MKFTINYLVFIIS